MSDDYAAMSSAAIVAILVVGFVEMHTAVQDLRALIDSAHRAGLMNFELSSTAARLMNDQFRPLRRANTLWMVLCAAMTLALILTFLWAAIDGHGPARWLAAYIFLTTAASLLFVLGGALRKVSDGYSNIRYQIRGEAPEVVTEHESAMGTE
ncbi:hypothetical protein [Streptomyces rhizosphaericus]|uniref:DUF2721 domain-containing protein n=1 Tax=Streptomyces rhizosphaericus TaxID=114699 RepID=A0A6G4ANE7_9ACTN|nr:hypothetical protein [Streptomyces rhizosphaericus]NEW74986.1 hypothetical protein [Streptomyces rhizosphaericus]